jgi:CIC family chloride channel protein
MIETPADGGETEDDGRGLLALAAGGLAVGLIAGALGSAFHATPNAADSLRESVLGWAQTPAWEWVVPALLAAGAAYVARGLVERYAPEVSGSGVQRSKPSSMGRLPRCPLRSCRSSSCYAPGLPGGLFAPLLVSGAAAGLLLGLSFKALDQALTIPMPAFAAIGMAALFIAVVRAPVTGIALVVEMTGATALLVPLLTAGAGALAISAMLGNRPIYDTLRDRDIAISRRSS